MGTMMAIVILMALHLVPSSVDSFQMTGGSSVTYRRQNGDTWIAKGENSRDDGTFTAATNQLVVKSKGFFGNSTITPEAEWGLKSDTKWADISRLSKGGDTISVVKEDGRIVFTLQQAGEKAQTVTVAWKTETK